MDYVALHTSSLWNELWEDKILTEKIGALKNQLLATDERDPHTLGKLRGQLEALQWLKTRIEAEAKLQMKKAAGEIVPPTESATRVAYLRQRRIV